VVSSCPTRRSLLGALVAALLLVAACSSDTNKQATTATQPGIERGTSSTTTTTVDAEQPTRPAAAYGVGSRTLHLVDTSRPTKASPTRGIAASNSRKLDVLVLYPTADAAGGSKAVPDAPVAEGRFPLVEFSHGVTASGPSYQPFLEPIAQAGYVIVAPTFPLTNGPGGWTDLGDYRNQPADVSFVLDQILALGTKAGDPLDGHLASREVAVAGHSLGAITTLGFANSCCEDERVKAMVEISGVELPYPKGTFTHPPKNLPTLLIHGVVDKTVPYKGSSQAFASFTAPRAFLTYPAAGHVDPVSKPAYAPVTVKTIEAFLALELRHDDSLWKALPAKPSVGSIKVAGGLAAPGG
jgi:pimeloyl-ACP methyl ester carboxylesterase